MLQTHPTQINWTEKNPSNFSNQNLQINTSGELIGTPQFETVRQTITAVDGLNTIDLNLGSHITLDLRSTTTDINLTLNNPVESSYYITVIDNATTARIIIFNTTSFITTNAGFARGTDSIQALEANTRYIMQLNYHSADPVLTNHFVVNPFNIALVNFEPVQQIFQNFTSESFTYTKNSVYTGLEVIDRYGDEQRLVQIGRGFDFDGIDDYIDAPHLTGTETVISSQGSAIPTISAGRVDFTAGTVWDLKLSDNTHYKCDDTGGSIVYDSSGNSNHGSLTNTNLTTVHTTFLDGTGADFQNQVGYTPTISFDGNTAQIAIGYNNTIDFLQNTAFTLQFKVRVNSTGVQVLLGNTDGLAGAGKFRVYLNATNNIIIEDNTTIIFTGQALNTATNYHIAIVRTGTGVNETTLYVNGVQDGIFTWATNQLDTNLSVNIGADNQGLTTSLDGLIGQINFERSALYTGNFLAPTTYSAYTITNETLLFLLHGDWDESVYVHDITQTNTQNVNIPRNETITTEDALGQALFFTGRVKYNAKLESATLTFNGINQRLTIASDPNLDLASEFTVDFWFNTNTTNTQTLFDVGVTNELKITLASSLSRLDVNVNGTTGASSQYVLPTTNIINEWHHLLVSRDSSNDVRVFLNGTLLTNNNSNTVENITGTITTADLTIGCQTQASLGQFFSGNLLNFRYTKGVALETFDFERPTNYETLNANTEIFLPIQEEDGLVAYDVAGEQHHATMTNFTVSSWLTSKQNFSCNNLALGYDVLFNTNIGTAYYTRPALTTEHSTGGIYTLDGWIRVESGGSNATVVSTQRSSSPFGWLVRVFSDGSLNVQYANNTVTNLTTGVGLISFNEWTHFAITRDGTTTRIFINGVEALNSTSTNTIFNAQGNFAIGELGNNLAGGFNYFGDIDYLRIIDGTALWTSNFTPPTTQAHYANTTNTIFFFRNNQVEIGSSLTLVGTARTPKTKIVSSNTLEVEPTNAGGYYHNGAETTFQNYNIPDIIAQDISNYMFDVSNAPNKISFADMVADRGLGKITVDVVDETNQKENHLVNKLL